VSVDITITLTDAQLDAIAERVAAKLADRRQPTAADAKRWMTVAEASDYLACSRQRVYDLRSSGRLSRHGDGRRGLVDREELDALVREGA
jgi:excisionase family DNA binding protein